jgi:hypothetical protein
MALATALGLATALAGSPAAAAPPAPEPGASRPADPSELRLGPKARARQQRKELLEDLRRGEAGGDLGGSEIQKEIRPWRYRMDLETRGGPEGGLAPEDPSLPGGASGLSDPDPGLAGPGSGPGAREPGAGGERPLTELERPARRPRPPPAPDLSTQRLSDEAAFHLSYSTSPEANSHGLPQTWRVRITDANGLPVTNAGLAVSVEGPGGGAAYTASRISVSELGEGLYRIKGIAFDRPGLWTVTLTVRARGYSDKAAFRLQVP